jgi:hypothetical protein
MEKDTFLQKIIANDSRLDTEIILKNTGISLHSSFRNLCLVLKNNKKITKLDLNSNRIGDMDCDELVNFLQKNDSVTELDLSGTSIGDKLIKSLSKGLINNHTLKVLDLSENVIGDEGIKALSFALETNTTLEILRLNYKNCFSNIGVRYLCEALEKNYTLIRLDSPDGKYGETEDILKIRSLIEHNNKILIEENPVIKNNLKAMKIKINKVPTLLEIGFFAVNQCISSGDISENNINIPEELSKKLTK